MATMSELMARDNLDPLRESAQPFRERLAELAKLMTLNRKIVMDNNAWHEWVSCRLIFADWLEEHAEHSPLYGLEATAARHEWTVTIIGHWLEVWTVSFLNGLAAFPQRCVNARRLLHFAPRTLNLVMIDSGLPIKHRRISRSGTNVARFTTHGGERSRWFSTDTKRYGALGFLELWKSPPALLPGIQPHQGGPPHDMKTEAAPSVVTGRKGNLPPIRSQEE